MLKQLLAWYNKANGGLSNGQPNYSVLVWRKHARQPGQCPTSNPGWGSGGMRGTNGYQLPHLGYLWAGRKTYAGAVTLALLLNLLTGRRTRVTPYTCCGCGDSNCY